MKSLTKMLLDVNKHTIENNNIFSKRSLLEINDTNDGEFNFDFRDKTFGLSGLDAPGPRLSFTCSS